jgi:hypothetical protein
MNLNISTDWDCRPAGQTTDCFDAMSAHLSAALDRRGVSHEVFPIGPPLPDSWTLYVSYVKSATRYLPGRDPGAVAQPGVKTAWLCENNLCGLVDHSFHFSGRSRAPNQTRFVAPWEPSIYRMEQKDNVVLIDHAMCYRDYTQEVVNWCCELPEEWAVWLMSSQKPKSHRALELPARVKVLPHMSLGDYLAATDCVRFFVCTHRESYGYSTLDFLVRGTKVLAHAGAGNRRLNGIFGIPVFGGKEEFQREITSNVEEPSALSEKARKICTTYDRIAETVVDKLNLRSNP